MNEHEERLNDEFDRLYQLCKSLSATETDEQVRTFFEVTTEDALIFEIECSATLTIWLKIFPCKNPRVILKRTDLQGKEEITSYILFNITVSSNRIEVTQYLNEARGYLVGNLEEERVWQGTALAKNGQTMFEKITAMIGRVDLLKRFLS